MTGKEVIRHSVTWPVRRGAALKLLRNAVNPDTTFDARSAVQILEPVIAAYAPDLIIVSAGYDAVAGDPLGGMNLSPELYGHLTERLARLAAGNKLVLALEGGYNLRMTAECARQCMQVSSASQALRCASSLQHSHACFCSGAASSMSCCNVPPVSWEGDYATHLESYHRALCWQGHRREAFIFAW